MAYEALAQVRLQNQSFVQSASQVSADVLHFLLVAQLWHIAMSRVVVHAKYNVRAHNCLPIVQNAGYSLVIPSAFSFGTFSISMESCGS